MLFVLLYSANFFAQEISNLPNFTLPSPQTFEMTKYGDVPINESSGRITPSIPIHTLTSGKLQLPITMNYVGNGVKVDQLATWTGINWTLNAGGVITRVANDVPDESVLPANRLLLSESEFNQYDLFPGTSDTYLVNGIFNTANDYYDVQPDIFHFSFPGGSGSFYLDKDFNPTIIKKENELKIEILGGINAEWNRTLLRNNKEFVITTQDGVKYYFGGTNAYSESQMVDRSDQDLTRPKVASSFHLTKIEHPYGDKIFFEYTSKERERILMKYPLTAQKVIF